MIALILRIGLQRTLIDYNFQIQGLLLYESGEAVRLEDDSGFIELEEQ